MQEEKYAKIKLKSKHFGSCFGHAIGKSTIGDIVKNKEKWLSIAIDNSSLSHGRHAKNQKLEGAMYLWLSDMSGRNAVINDWMLIEKVKELDVKLNVTDFVYSCGFKS